MVVTHTTNDAYTYPFPTVTLAFFLRYLSPKLNPFAAHVLSTDTIESRVDAATGRLHTTRIHLKKSRMPAAVFKLLPSSMTGGAKTETGVGGKAGERASYVLETSVVDMKEGWMRTESRNLNWTGVLSVVEQQHYQAPQPPVSAAVGVSATPSNAFNTNVSTTFIFRSRLGERLRGRMASATSSSAASSAVSAPATTPAPQGWLSGWMGNPIQRSIESLASKKTRDGIARSREGMMVVMERLRSAGGVPGVLEIMRREKQGAFA
jgi:4-amino-4-deoxychorismate lyase